MEFVVSLIGLFSASPIYDNVESLAIWMLTHITPVLVIIAMWVRLVETQLDGFSTQSRYAAAVRDFLWYGFLLSAYMALGMMISYAFNNFYGLLSEKGSFEVIFTQMQAFIEDINQMDKTDGGVGGAALNLLTAPATGIAYFIYYLSLIVVVFMLVVMRLALAVGYGLVFVWGLVAIPLSMTSNFKLLRGWGIFAAGILLWPVMESILIWFFSPVLTAAAQNLVSGDASSFMLEKAGVYMLYTVLNFLIIAIIIAAPLIAGVMAANNSAMSSLVMPFAGAAMAASAATIKASQQRLFGGLKGAAAGMGGSELAMASSGKLEGMARSMTGMGPAANPGASSLNRMSSSNGRLAESLRSQPTSTASPGASTATASTEPSQVSAKNNTVDTAVPSQANVAENSSTAKKAVAATAVHQVITAANSVSEATTAASEGQAPASKTAEAPRKRNRSSEVARSGHFINKNLKNKGKQ